MTHATIIWMFNWMERHGLVHDTLATKALIFCLAMAIAAATYHFVETPARKWGRWLALGSPVAISKPVAVTPD